VKTCPTISQGRTLLEWVGCPAAIWRKMGNLPRVHSTCGDDFLVVVGKIHIKFKHAENRKFIKIYKHKKHQESFYARKNENVLKNKENYMYIP
jgi:hypothetical protein